MLTYATRGIWPRQAGWQTCSLRATSGCGRTWMRSRGLVFPEEERQENVAPSARHLKRFVQQRRREYNPRARFRPIPDITEFRKPQFPTPELLGVEIDRHREAAILGRLHVVAVPVAVAAAHALVARHPERLVLR